MQNMRGTKSSRCLQKVFGEVTKYLKVTTQYKFFKIMLCVISKLNSKVSKDPPEFEERAGGSNEITLHSLSFHDTV